VVWKVGCDYLGYEFVGASFVGIDRYMGQEDVNHFYSCEPFGDAGVAGFLGTSQICELIAECRRSQDYFGKCPGTWRRLHLLQL